MSDWRPDGPRDVLLVEDNYGDVRLTQEAFKGGYANICLHVVKDGVEALEFLRREDKFSDAVRPDLILLDLNLPRMDGRQVLADIKTDPALKSIPVIVLTTSNSPMDIKESYGHHANSYVTKPHDLKEFFKVIRALEDFWLRLVKLPPK